MLLVYQRKHCVNEMQNVRCEPQKRNPFCSSNNSVKNRPIFITIVFYIPKNNCHIIQAINYNEIYDKMHDN